MPISRVTVTVAAACLAAIAALTVPVPDPGTADTLPIPASSVTDGHPATWQPCTTIGYTVNASLAPPGSLDDLTEVLADITTGTGIQFQLKGSTTRIPQDGDLASGPVRDDAPLTVAWAHQPTAGGGPDQSDLLSEGGDVAGRTTATTAYRARRGLLPARNRILAADVVIDADLAIDPADRSWGGRSGQRAFLQHEMLHALGLDHTPAAGSVLSPTLLPGKYSHIPEPDLHAVRALNGTCTR